jgi:Ca2+-binding EF-hand superfamily protein
MLTMTSHEFAANRPVTWRLGAVALMIAGLLLTQAAYGYQAQKNAARPVTTAQPKKTNAPQEQQSSTAQNLLRSDFIKLMDADFRKRDQDGNGKATRAEVEDFAKRTALALAQEQNRALFLRLDIDRNGLLTAAEFAGLVPSPQFPDVSEEMTRFDSNRDQIITLVEYRSATLANFDRMDADKDGVLVPSELTKLKSPPLSPPIER